MIFRAERGRIYCLNNIAKFLLFLIIIVMLYQCKTRFELQSNRIQGIEYRAGGYLHSELLKWGKVTPKGPTILVAGNKESFEVIIDINKEIPEGSIVGIFLHFISDFDPFQTTNPEKSNFLSCESDQVDFDIFTYSNPKVHGGKSFFPYSRWAEIKLRNAAKPGAKILFKFKNCSIQTYEETLFNIRFAIITNNKITGYLGDADFEIVGSEMHHLQFIAPTCEEPFEKTDCKIVVLDRNRNKSGLDLSNLKFNIKVFGSDEPLDYEKIVYDKEKRHHVIKGLKFSEEGVYYLEVNIEGNKSVRGISNPIVVRKNWIEKVYFGDLHQHCNLSDGRGVAAANYEYAISTGCLDFLSAMDHEEGFYGPARIFMPASTRQNGGNELIEAAEKYNGPDLVTITGSEVSSRLFGHINKYYLNINKEDAEFLFGKDRKNAQTISDSQDWLDILSKTSKGDDWLILPHAHAGVGSLKYKTPEFPDHMTNIEICSMHGIFDENYKGWLAAGHLVGVNGAGDNHMTNVGLSKGGYHYPNTNGLCAVYASSKSREGIWNGIKMRKTYAVTASQRIFLDFSINMAKMGEVSNDIQSNRKIKVEVAGTAPIYKIELFKNNELVETFKHVIKNKQYIRLNWYDDITGRRVDDSKTSGRVVANNGNLELINSYNAFNKSDSFEENSGTIEFRTNAYSGTARGVIIKTNGADQLSFAVEDIYLDTTILNDTRQIELAKLPIQFKQVLMKDYVNMFTFEKGAYFYLDADWVDPQASKTSVVEWQDKVGEECYYYVRVEQLDRNIAWSSPIWFTKSKIWKP